MSKGKSSDLEKAMKDKIAGKDECVQVMVRCRPLSSTEKTNKNTKIVDLDRKARAISVRNPNSSEEAPKVFTFDNVFDESCTQKSIYEDGARGIIESVMGGYNGTIFAYGQTGTGKTFTMEGAEPEDLKGIIPRSFEHIFQQIDQSADTQFLVRASFLEIYNDDVLDLLGDDPTVKLELKENPDSGVYVKNLQSFVMKGVAEINELLQNGKKNRKTGSTLMNKDSSRSHCIFTVTVETSAAAADGEQHIRVGKLNMVDLAGSERQSKTGAAGSTLKEATKINLSLSALGNVISALTNPKIAHVPYRDSKLTRLLQDSLGGNTKTVMIANLGPADYNFDETISTLRFASRAKAIKNKPKINEDPKDAMLREFQDEIARLKAMLEAEDGGIPPEGMASPSGLRGAAPSDGSAQHFAKQKIIVNKVIQKVVQKGISPEELRKLEEDAAARKRDLEAKHEKEKNEILNLKQQLESKSETTQKELQQKEEILEKQKQDRLALKQKLKAVEAKLLLGNKILDNAQKEAMRLEKNKRELERQKQERERVEAELRAKEEAQLELADKYETLDKNVAEKTAKLNKLRDKYAEIKKEVEDVQAENQKEREELLETIRELTRHIQLKDMILDNFVPREEHEKVEHRAYWDEERDEWLLHETDFAALNSEIRRPISARAPPGAAQAVAAAQMSGGVVGTIDGIETGSLLLSRIRPQSEFARLKATVGQDPNPRFRIDNIIDLELDMPERTTQDYHELQMQLSQQNAGMGGHQEEDYMYGADPYGGGQYDRPRTAARGGGRPQSRFS